MSTIMSFRAAFNRGEPLQIRNEKGVWKDWSMPHSPRFDSPIEDYRIKPRLNHYLTELQLLAESDPKVFTAVLGYLLLRDGYR